MTATEMLDLLKSRTKQADPAKLLPELRSACRWVARRVYNSESGPDLLLTVGSELAIAATTRDYDLGANIPSGELLGIKRLWVKLPGDATFTPMTEVDLDTPPFLESDTRLAADPLIATGHPVFYSKINFSKVRFAPALPASSTLRADYFRVAPAPDPTTNNTSENGSDLPSIFHDAVVSKACAQVFSVLDDTRVGEFETRARDEIRDAIVTAMRGVQKPTQTKPFTRGRRRMF